MKKVKEKKYKFSDYAKYFNSQVKSDSCTNFNTLHTMSIERFDKELKSFYSQYPDFFVGECNKLLQTLNNDYYNYEKWMVDE